MIIQKLIVTTLILLTTNFLFAQPGLNIQNRINSKVQTRIPGNVENSNSFRSTPPPPSNKINIERNIERPAPRPVIVRPEDNRTNQDNNMRPGSPFVEQRDNRDRNAAEQRRFNGAARNRN